MMNGSSYFCLHISAIYHRAPPRHLGGYGGGPARLVFAEDTAVVILMVIFSAEDAAVEQWEKFRGKEHGENGRGEIHPEGGPEVRERGAAEGSGGIHAHAGDRRFKNDKQRNARAGKETGKPGDFRLVGHDEDDQEEQ